MDFLNIHTTGISESQLHEKIHPSLDATSNLTVTYLTKHTEVTIRLGTKAGNQTERRQLLQSTTDKLTLLIGEFIWGFNDETLSAVTGKLLRKHSLTVSTAESCTGGLVSSYITDESGSSNYFEQGYVTYSNAAKMAVLGVKSETLNKHGAVSEQTVREMVSGLLELSHADYAISVSGIIEPDKAISDKPVVYIAIGNRDHTTVKKQFFDASRILNKEMAATTALNLLRLRVMEDYKK